MNNFSKATSHGDAYRWGYAASYDGAPKDGNPYDGALESDHYYFWNNGWWDARRAEEQRSKYWLNFGHNWKLWSYVVHDMKNNPDKYCSLP
jgi:hypothetical protein